MLVGVCIYIDCSISVNFWFQHLGSEKLKLDKHWTHLVAYLKSVETMNISMQKMRNVLQFFGMKNVTDEQVKYYIDNVYEVSSSTVYNFDDLM